MLRKRVQLVLILAGLLMLGLPALVCGLGYYVYVWLKVDPIAVAPGSTESERIAAVETWLDDLFQQNKFNGGVLVVRDGEVLLSKTCGFTDHTTAQRLNDHSTFQLASVSKQFTAAGVLRLAELGRLNLDDPVAKHLKECPFTNLTVRHLLNQTSGIPDEYMALAEQHREAIGEVLTISKAVELVFQYSKASQPPGESMEYSNSNYVLLAGIVEAVSGMSFEVFMQKELFQPLGMHDTRIWTLTSKVRSPNQVKDFDQVDDERSPVEPSWLDGVAGDGAVHCSLHDFVLWDQFWYGNPLVSDSLLKQAFEPPTLNDGTRAEYGFGWVLEQDRHWHNGSWLGANTYIVRYPKSRSCLVVLDNSSNLRLETIASQIESTLQPIFSAN